MEKKIEGKMKNQEEIEEMKDVNASNDTLVYYEGLIKEYESGNHEPLLTNLYNKLLAADECKTKTAEDLKSYLR